MEATFSARPECATCPARIVCHCLQVTEDVLLSALESAAVCSVRDIRARTGAGDGCTACHRKLKKYLEARVALPMA